MWAKPVADTHLENFYQVSPMLYRSAQPYVDNFRELQQRGIGEVLDLRLYHKDVPAADTSLTLQHVPLFASELDPQRIVTALQVIANARKPVLVHCLHGSDRTGAVVALYRIVCQGWSKQQALAEMEQGNFGYHPVFSNIPDFINNADVESIRQQVQGPACPAN
jgi:protein tyrosine phosphatase (PTP) superfamily phosphohydrolase (DUF442 family)